MKFYDNYKKISWEVKEEGKHIARQNAIPSSGVFVKGDKIYNNFKTDITCEGWICTVGGDFSATAPTFKKFGIIES